MTEPEALRGHAEFEHRMRAEYLPSDYWIRQYMIAIDECVYMLRKVSDRRPAGGVDFLTEESVPQNVLDQAALRGYGWYFDLSAGEIEGRVADMEEWTASQAAWLRERAVYASTETLRADLVQQASEMLASPNRVAAGLLQTTET